MSDQMSETAKVKSEKEKPMIQAMAEDLKEIRECMQRLEKMGFSRELMEIYIYKKSSVNLTDVRAVLDTQKKFLDEAFKPANS